ncbi:MAG: methylenetetrahydrofolate reductase [Oscillatoriales cyanobacterium]|uniref:Methylenetetrahydrofolate reductase n=1 Tax=Microcoleus anatoxicus PTRS2 TaxID=2705321 RepID=A0ABU8YGF3_9CYAN|nr:MAG: methylenetetrahydrofolate reductase [Oscillatoriales cyanobacterium]TAD97123.1 MAG: methylenetetrahydrofolate reductase [Oscillatoriales cyanobacterium]TAE04648.1 MAG: methylenetetrahydrofolate reductase [Oscillatoriales cyanobacterium]TAF01715.1 MAG: methylenetetrahydrofolate reductase [Oscillatoriales cyanobacterium]TAF36999.1 MAG: methylenetetrahydrofolate reductase [Oscillatoriales cyanobacterium]
MNRFRTACTTPGEFIITAEVAPPKGGDMTHTLAMAEMLKNRVHAINITDGSRAVLRMCPLAVSVILLQHGIEPICQVACRDRNQIGLQADLMGAQALGIRNILALTGDPVKAGDHPKAKSVFDFEAVRLLQAIQKMNSGKDWNDKPLTDGVTDLFAGAAVDPQCPSWSGLQSRFEKKLEAGAQFFQSQLITDFKILDKFMHHIAAGSNKPVLAGIFLFKSAKNAEFIKKNVPGVHIPQETIDRLAKAPEPLQEGIKIAAEQVKLARQICQGVHMMAVKREDLIPQILDLAGIKPMN